MARDCFLAEGYAATSMSTIAARLGGSKGTLYSYFKNKENLFAAMMQRQCAEIQAALFEVAFDDMAPRARLQHIAHTFLERLMSPESIAIQRLVIGEGGRFPEIGRLFYENGPQVVMERIAHYLRELMADGHLRTADPAAAAQHFKDLAISGAYWSRLWNASPCPTTEALRRQVDEAVETFLRAYAL